MSSVGKVALVTGGSSGIGRCTALALKDAGCTVYELSRHDAGLPGVTHLTADVTDEAAVAAAAAIPFQPYYSASKAAINSYTCALANEVRPYGVTVTAVQPGDIATGFTDARKKTMTGDEEYGGRISRSVAGMEKDEREGMRPETAGAYICRIALKKRVKPLYAIGFLYKGACVLCQLLPCRFRNWLIGLIYAR